MAKKKNQKKTEAQARKSAVETLRFQTHWGLKQLGQEYGNMFHQLADSEIDFFKEFGLAQDILELKSLVDGVKRDIGVNPTPEKGDFCTSINAIALGISSIPVLEHMQMPVSWQDLITKKILTIYYPMDIQNAVIDWAKANGFNTTTYLSQPIVKFKQFFVIIKRTR